MIASVGSRFLSAFGFVLFLAILHPAEVRGEAPKGAPVEEPAPAPAPPISAPAPPAGAAPASPAPAGGVPVPPGPGFPHGPQINAFSGPAKWIPGESVTLTWSVGPSPAGGSVPVVGLFQREEVIASALPPSGTREVRVTRYPVGATSVEFTLKAYDRGGNSSRTLRIPILSAQRALQQLSVSLESDPREFGPGTPLELRVRIGSEVWPMRGMNIRVTNGTRVAGELREFVVRAPMMPARIRYERFSGESREFAVEIEYRGNRLSKRFPLHAVPYYTLAPAPR